MRPEEWRSCSVAFGGGAGATERVGADGATERVGADGEAEGAGEAAGAGACGWMKAARQSQAAKAGTWRRFRGGSR